MKKIIAVILAVLMIIALVACGADSRYTLTYGEGRLVTVQVNDESKNLVGAFCEFTNLSGETCLPCDAVNVKAFQNGKELSVMVFTGTETDGYLQCDTSIQSGTTAKVVWLFQPSDESIVLIEFSDGQKFSVEIK
ncbi:MAG TPA: DUF5067 domain-containing protein [Bacillota bacterium]|nr:DUF5067 domain-containing protein [Bacillota bacterium]